MNANYVLTSMMLNSLLVSWIEAQCNLSSISPCDLDYDLVSKILTQIGTLTNNDVNKLYDKWYVELRDQLRLKRQLVNQ